MKSVKVTLLLLLMALGFTNVSFAQPEDEYNDLMFLLVDQKYEKLLYKAEGYIEDEETRRDALPYLYTSMAYYEMSKLEEFDEEYPRAFKDAVKYCVKYRKKDKSGFYVADNAEYIDDLKKQVYEIADNYYNQGKASKAKSYYKYLVGMDPSDYGAWLLKGVVEAELNMKTEAEMSFEQGVNGVENLESTVEYWDGKLMLLKMGIISYSNYLVSNGRVGEAKTMMEKGNEFLGDDNEFKIAYDDIMRA